METALATERSAGGVTVFGYQDIGQVEERWGQASARTILANCAIKAQFNPQEIESAKKISEYLGEEEIQRKQKSKGHSGGKASTNVSDTDHTRRLFSPDRFLRLKKGHCVLINPGYENREEIALPSLEKIKIPQQFRDKEATCRSLWNTKIRPRLVQRSPQPKLSRDQLRVYFETVLKQRYEEAERILPMLSASHKSGMVAKKPNPQMKQQLQAAF